jgi:hypothetical protein
MGGSCANGMHPIKHYERHTQKEVGDRRCVRKTECGQQNPPHAAPHVPLHAGGPPRLRQLACAGPPPPVGDGGHDHANQTQGMCAGIHGDGGGGGVVARNAAGVSHLCTLAGRLRLRRMLPLDLLLQTSATSANAMRARVPTRLRTWYTNATGDERSRHAGAMGAVLAQGHITGHRPQTHTSTRLRATSASAARRACSCVPTDQPHARQGATATRALRDETSEQAKR